MQKLRLFFVDDRKSYRIKVKSLLEQSSLGFAVDLFDSDTDYYNKVKSMTAPDIALLDISIHDNDNAGLKMAQFTRQHFPSCVIIMYSQLDDTKTIISYMRVGVSDFISKSTPDQSFASQVHDCYQCALSKRIFDQENSHEPLNLGNVVCVGKSTKEIIQSLRSVVASHIKTVYISGKTGTGKEVVARIIESLSKEKFLTINCGAITPSLMESQLFGYAKGAFTGAFTAKEGLFEAANGGWVFLDEVADLSPSAQVALLRVIENQEIVRVGENQPRPIKVRIVSATNGDLDSLVWEGKFRQDLFERLQGHVVKLKPLCERREEIPHFIKFFVGQNQTKSLEIPSTTLDMLTMYDWPANIRELRNTINNMMSLTKGNFLNPSAIPVKIIESISDAANQGENKKYINDESPKVQILSAPTHNLPETHIFQATKSKLSSDEKITFEFNMCKDRFDMCEIEDYIFLGFIEYLITKKEIVTMRKLAAQLSMNHVTLTRRLRHIASNGQCPEFVTKLI